VSLEKTSIALLEARADKDSSRIIRRMNYFSHNYLKDTHLNLFLTEKAAFQPLFEHNVYGTIGKINSLLNLLISHFLYFRVSSNSAVCGKSHFREKITISTVKATHIIK
jgi:hypothetical protein